MAKVIYPNGSPGDENPYTVTKNLSSGVKVSVKVFHPDCGGVIIATGNIIEGIEAKE